MFTGIVTDVGTIAAVDQRATGVRLTIRTAYDTAAVDLGASIACAGICLTVVERGMEPGNAWFSVEASVETLAKTTMGDWTAGTRINLERALRMGDELGGHMVTGHVDGTARLVERTDVADMARLTFDVPARFAKFIAEKGSVTLDGTSLTVNDVAGTRFAVMLIPHTLTVTTWGGRAVGDAVNLEVDIMARYVARLTEAG